MSLHALHRKDDSYEQPVSNEFDYPPVHSGDFIPENIFYLLAMKANNKVAKDFQLKVFNKILPSIRNSLLRNEAENLESFLKDKFSDCVLTGEFFSARFNEVAALIS